MRSSVWRDWSSMLEDQSAIGAACWPFSRNRGSTSSSEISLRRPGRRRSFSGGIGDDPVEPGAEGRLTPERVDLPYHGPERVLHDFLGVPRVSRDAAREAIRAVAVGGDEKLCCGRLPAPQCLHEKTIAIDSRRSRLTHRHSFPRLGLVYRQGEGPWQTPPDGNARIPVWRRGFAISSRA